MHMQVLQRGKKRELIGVLGQAAKAVRSGRVFVHRLIALYPGHVVGGKSGLVFTVCACAKNPMISWGIVYHMNY